MAPHIIRPMRFVLPAVPGPRSPFMLRIGLLLYDWLGARKILPGAQQRRPHPSRHRPAAVAEVPLRLRIFRLLGRRFPAGRAQRARRRRARRHDPHPHARHPRRARGRLAADPQRAGPPRGRDRARSGQRRRALGRRRVRDRAAHGGHAAVAARQGQPHRGARSCSTTTAATFSRTPTSASCSRCRSRTTSR